MTVRLGQTATVLSLAAAASALSNKNAAGAAAGLLATGLVKVDFSGGASFPTINTNGIPKFEPKIPNLNKFLRKRDKCIDLQLKFLFLQINFKLPTLNLLFTLPELPTFNLQYIIDLLGSAIQCVLEAMALIALIEALKKGASPSEAAAAQAAVYTAAAAAREAEAADAAITSSSVIPSSGMEFFNPNL
jgi:hypothetical protein